MNATKRKFNALLQGIGAKPPAPLYATDSQEKPDLFSSSPLNRPSTPTFSPQLDDTSSPSKGMATTPSDFLSKRRRVGPDAAVEPEKGSPTTVSNIVLRKWTPGSNAAAPSRETMKLQPPKYCPGDRDELIRRLGTFQELTQWTPKPDKINEFEWAKRGWVCRSKDCVQCTLCRKELIVKTSKSEEDGVEVAVLVDSDIEKALVKRFVEMIVDAHDEDCLWRKRGCDDSLLRLPLASPPTALASLRERYDDLLARESFLPYFFDLRLPTDFDLQATKSQLTPTFFSDPPPPSTKSPAPNDVALALALAGWQGLTNPRIGAVPNSATCATCLRRLGLWMFRSREVDEATRQILVPAPMAYLDPIREHRFFCPWRNAAVQHNPGAKTADNKTAWEILAQTIKNHAYLQSQAEKSTRRFKLHRPAMSLPATPAKAGKSEGGAANSPLLSPNTVDGGGGGDDEDASARDAKDKERWARLRRVKSLFNTKNSKKLQRTASRPDSTASRPPTASSRQGSAPPPETPKSLKTPKKK
ncbi:zf-C3HC-domain-containing protein [Durotheca rogersii]|uniref:zf-C3HC-domain-containing protein n=1 Tax=Durotheca rogersii TaxID=419775 RepID=UPI0022207E79|nr:zf-C3HC-domain-containing protein [Durotheca rogersii]KAI5861314.1 zf-C3HC-domain-containing protein [Durotheca rogersii]